MKKATLIILAVMMISFLVSAGAYAEEKITSSTSATTHRASNLIGAAVINQQGDNLGKISDLVIDSQNDRVTFAIFSESRMLGLSTKLIPVPINALTIKDEKTVIINITKDKLAKAPSFEKNNWPDMTNRQWSEDTHRFYGVQPGWGESGMGTMKEEGKSIKEGMMEKVGEKGKSMKEGAMDKMEEKGSDMMKKHMDTPKY